MKRKKLLLCLVGALILALGAAFAALPPSPGETYYGIDISSFQGDIDFEAVREYGIEFVYIRSSQGTAYIDPYFSRNYYGVTQSGMLVGAYHVLAAQDEEGARQEARFFAELLQNRTFHGKPAFEYVVPSGLTEDRINANALAFISELRSQTGLSAVLYSDAYSAQNVFNADVARAAALWVAQYGVQEPSDNDKWSSYAGFQYTDAASVDGISGDVDADIFTSAMLQTAPAPSATPDPTVTPPPSPTPERGLYLYPVERGDTLSRIARRYDSNTGVLARLNALDNPNLIFIGETIYVLTEEPDGLVRTNLYTVRRGDTLSSIAYRFFTTVEELALINDIDNVNIIRAGQRLIVWE